jgi:hypothetical protein
VVCDENCDRSSSTFLVQPHSNMVVIVNRVAGLVTLLRS